MPVRLTVPALLLLGALAFGAAMPLTATSAHAHDTGDGLVRVASPHSVEKTIGRLRTALEDKGITIFADIDHAANAAAMDLEMPATHLLIFGSPKIGSPLMRRNPAIGIDLPIKTVAYEDDQGQVWLAYNDPAYLAERHNLPADLKPFVGMRKALDGFILFAVKK
ncbi:DUF302 domain-containing protein [Roseospira visakhapatnamensis]|uniref:Uncharacterized protein (DUF302 family) n=1 Tax=Roseospira visakhapatnamensis TaxID=390880 RepID=A0A7W6WBL3_9PROT|nr:DUF302 domain-containing protein [Roseospira visakhapatnamensis]MBB4267948.1 uncharacterized protein (DUF302 family) [Roseospira visakhapatnamensis]